MSLSSIEVQRIIESRELDIDINALRTKTLKGLVSLQEEVLKEYIEGITSGTASRNLSGVDKAVANAALMRRIIPIVGEILLETNIGIKYSEGFFTRSLINVEPVGKDNDRHVGLRFGPIEIVQGNERSEFERAWQGNAIGSRRNIQTLAKLSPLQVINKAYLVISRI